MPPKVKSMIEVRRNNNHTTVPEAELLPFLYSNFLLTDESIMQHISDETVAKWTENICILVSEITDSMPLQRIARAGVAIAQSGDRTKILTHIYDTILTYEGLSTLRGFGLAKVEINEGHRKIKAMYFINPEKTTIRSTEGL